MAEPIYDVSHTIVDIAGWCDWCHHKPASIVVTGQDADHPDIRWCDDCLLGVAVAGAVS